MNNIKKKIIVKENDNKERLDSYIANLKELDFSRSKVKKLIKENKIFVNNKIVKESYIVKENDEITIESNDDEDQNQNYLKPENIKLDIRYEDDDVLVVNKEKGMVVHPGNGNKEHTLVNAVMAYSKLSDINKNVRPRNST